MSIPGRIYYCPACGKVAEERVGPESLRAQRCEGIHQEYVREDLFRQLLLAIAEHEKAVEREVSKNAWARANTELARVRARTELMLESEDRDSR